MTFEDLKAHIDARCPGAAISGSKGTIAALRRQQLAAKARNVAFPPPPSRPLLFEINHPDGYKIGSVVVTTSEDGSLYFELDMQETWEDPFDSKVYLMRVQPDDGLRYYLLYNDEAILRSGPGVSRNEVIHDWVELYGKPDALVDQPGVWDEDDAVLLVMGLAKDADAPSD